MLKMKVEPTMCMKTQKTMTKCHANNPVFCGKMHRTTGSQRKSVGIVGRKCACYAIIEAKQVAMTCVARASCPLGRGHPARARSGSGTLPRQRARCPHCGPTALLRRLVGLHVCC
jgi:hypothetical protein